MGALDSLRRCGDKLRIPCGRNGIRIARLAGATPTVHGGERMAANKTLACGEETHPTTAGGCEEDLFTAAPVDNPFGSF